MYADYIRSDANHSRALLREKLNPSQLLAMLQPDRVTVFHRQGNLGYVLLLRFT